MLHGLQKFGKMLLLLRHKLAFLAVPKTGSTAIEFALRPYAEIIFARNRKHLPARRFKRRIAPFLSKNFGAELSSVAIMRDPVDQIRSWYRYRSEPRLDGNVLSTRGIDFETFVLEVCSASPPPRAQIGSQFEFLTFGDGRIAVDHLFSYEKIPDFIDYLSENHGLEISLKAKNISPDVTAELSSDALSALESRRSHEFDLYRTLQSSGGHIEAPLEFDKYD